MAKPYSVNLWCSHPDEGNDDCATGDDFNTKREALECLYRPHKHTEYFARVLPTIRYIQIDGPDIHAVVHNPRYRKQWLGGKTAAEDEWKREIRMQAAMTYGVQGWNDNP